MNSIESDALLKRAMDQLNRGNLTDAESLATQVIGQIPGSAAAYHVRGLVDLQRSQDEAAMPHLREAVRLAPESADYRNSLGVVLVRASDIRQAIEEFARAVRISPSHTHAVPNLIRALKQEGDPEFSIHIVESLTDAVSCFDLENLKARALSMLGRRKEARQLYIQLLQQDSKQIDTIVDLGFLELDVDEVPAAESRFRDAIAFAPTNSRALHGLGRVFERRGEPDKALEAWSRSLDADSSFPPVLTSMGVLQIQLGNLEEGRTLLKRALKAAPHYADAYLALANSTSFGPGDSEWNLLESLAESQKVTGEELVKVHFAFARSLENEKDYGRAFQHYDLGCKEKRKLVDFDISEVKEQSDRIIEYFSKDRIRSMDSVPCTDSDAPIFVVGMPRSGTTLVEQIVASHRNVFGAGELPHVETILTLLPSLSLTNAPYPQCLDTIPPEDLKAIAEHHLETLIALGTDADRVVDKMPRNVYNLGLIRLLFPRAKILHCRRSPLDVCISNLLRYYPSGQPFSWDQSELGDYFRDYERITRHWRDVLGDGYLEVQYEELVEHQENVTRQMISFLDLDWDPDCLRYHESARRVKTNPIQVRKPIYRTSISRWQRYSDWLGPLKSALGDLVDGCE